MRASMKSLFEGGAALRRKSQWFLALSMCAMILLLAGAEALADRSSRGGPHFRGHRHYGKHDYRGPRVSFGFYYGGPYWGWGYPYRYSFPYYYDPFGPPYYPYYEPDITIRRSPPVYIERDPSASGEEEEPAVWYYCPESKGYYPYVKECPGGWQTVPAQPPDMER